MFSVEIKTEKEVIKMREGGKQLAAIMEELKNAVKPGVKTLELDKLAEEMILKVGGTPAFKGYGDDGQRFPSTICASINDEVVHGIPSDKRILREGDLFKVDIGMKKDGFFSDMARSINVGKTSFDAQNIASTAENAFWEGVNQLKSGVHLSEYSKAIDKYISATPYSIVKSLVGHGIGRKLHESPQIPNYYDHTFEDLILKSGMTLAFEPMINEGVSETYVGDDGWVFKTADGKLSAHYENTVLITENGYEVLTAI